MVWRATPRRWPRRILQPARRRSSLRGRLIHDSLMCGFCPEQTPRALSGELRRQPLTDAGRHKKLGEFLFTSRAGRSSHAPPNLLPPARARGGNPLVRPASSPRRGRPRQICCEQNRRAAYCVQAEAGCQPIIGAIDDRVCDSGHVGNEKQPPRRSGDRRRSIPVGEGFVDLRDVRDDPNSVTRRKHRHGDFLEMHRLISVVPSHPDRQRTRTSRAI